MTILQFDLSQIEWRAAAWLSQDKVMIHEINSGIDQHVQACIDPNLMNIGFKDKSDPESKRNRNHAKTFNFRMIYKGSAWGFYLDPDMPKFPLNRWESIANGFYNKYSGLATWQEETIKTVYKQNGFIRIPTGRCFQFKKSLQKDGSYDYNEKSICNYPIQGISGGDVLPLCAVIIRRGIIKYGIAAKLILTVHDSLVYDVKDDVDKLARLCMLTVRSLPNYISEYFGINWNVDLDGEIEIGPNYGSIKPYEVEL